MSASKLDQVTLFFTQKIIILGFKLCFLYLKQLSEDHLLEEKEVLKLLPISCLPVSGLLRAMYFNKV